MPRLIAAQRDEVQSSTYHVDEALADADPGRYDALVLPGGVANPDQLRTDDRPIRFIQEIFSAGKPVGVICHGPWTLVEADLVRGRKLTSWPSLQTDIRNVGGEWVDQEVVVDNGLVSSRRPEDLQASAKIIEEFTDGRQAPAVIGSAGDPKETRIERPEHKDDPRVHRQTLLDRMPESTPTTTSISASM